MNNRKETMPKISIVIADDHPMFRSGVRQALEKEHDLTVVGEAGDGEHALQLLLELSPRIALLDISMPVKSGLAAYKEYKQGNGTTKAIFLTMFDDEEILNEAMDLGVMGYLLKESASMDVVTAVRTVAGGQYYISPLLTGKLVARSEKKENFDQRHPGLATLSDTERTILRLIAESKTSRQIADELLLSPKTIDNYRFRISEKLGLTGSYSLLKFSLENKRFLS